VLAEHGFGKDEIAALEWEGAVVAATGRASSDQGKKKGAAPEAKRVGAASSKAAPCK
jgi:hypothetical protein